MSYLQYLVPQHLTFPKQFEFLDLYHFWQSYKDFGNSVHFNINCLNRGKSGQGLISYHSRKFPQRITQNCKNFGSMIFRMQFPEFLRYCKPMFGGNFFLEKITQNSRFQVTLFGLHQSTYMPMFRSISHSVTQRYGGNKHLYKYVCDTD